MAHRIEDWWHDRDECLCVFYNVKLVKLESSEERKGKDREVSISRLFFFW
jgi:hypothetical protein